MPTVPSPVRSIRPSREDLLTVFRLKYGEAGRLGPAPRLWKRFGYFTPDEVYEALVRNLVPEGGSWVDIGGGRDLFPGNAALARQLAARCALLVGVDPSANIHENPWAHERVQAFIEDYRDDRQFDLATLRMVAEHITQPERTAEAIARLLRPGGKVVIYTVSRYAPVTLLSAAVPFRFHHPIKALIWKSEEKDTFPTAYLMNTRQCLADLFARHGCRERFFARAADCRLLYRFPMLHLAELAVWRVLSAVNCPYPENCLLGVYEKSH